MDSSPGCVHLGADLNLIMKGGENMLLLICNQLENCKRNHECQHSVSHKKDEHPADLVSTCDHSFCAGSLNSHNVKCVNV